MQVWEQNIEIIINQIQNNNKAYEEYLKEKYAAYEFICIFGVGNIGLVTARELTNHGIKVDFFCDNDLSKNKKIFMGIPCFLPEKLIELSDRVMVIISTRYYQEIFQQLQKMGIKNIDRVFTNKFEVYEKLNYLGRSRVIEKINHTVDILEDETSRNVYTAILKNWLTLEYSQAEIDAVFTNDQYFCKDVFALSDKEYFVDGGAYDGDTFQSFLAETRGKFEKAYLFELSKSNYLQLVKNIGEYDKEIQKKVHCINKGLAEQSMAIRYCDNDEGSMVDSVGDTEGYLTSIDEACAGIPISYIKMDIEGSEQQALSGAKSIIKDRKPKLAICLYHKFEDLWEIPLCIHALMPEYKIYIRHHTDLLNETVCYATV